MCVCEDIESVLTVGVSVKHELRLVVWVHARISSSS